MALKVGDKVTHKSNPSLEMVVISIKGDDEVVVRWIDKKDNSVQKQEFLAAELQPYQPPKPPQVVFRKL